MGAKSFRDTKKTREAWQAQEEDAQDTEVKGRDREGKRDKPFPICVPSIQCRTNVQKLETMTIVEARISRRYKNAHDKYAVLLQGMHTNEGQNPTGSNSQRNGLNKLGVNPDLWGDHL